MALNEMAKEYHRKEVLDLVASRSIDELMDKWLSLHEKIDNLYLVRSEITNSFQKQIVELEYVINEQKKQISELESKLAVKEELSALKTAVPFKRVTPEFALGIAGFSEDEINRLLGNEETLPFSSDECEEETKTELPTMPIDVASMLINATIEYPTISLLKAFGAGETSVADKYSKSDLREIAEHLLVYCNNSDENSNTQS